MVMPRAYENLFTGKTHNIYISELSHEYKSLNNRKNREISPSFSFYNKIILLKIIKP